MASRGRRAAGGMTSAMTAEWLGASAEAGTFLVVLVSAIAALVQLRHIRAGNQLQALLALERDFRAPELQAALSYVQEELAQRLEDSSYRRQLESIGFVDPEMHPEMIACNWLNEMGTLVKRDLVSEDTFMDLFARLIVHCWKQVSPAIAIMRRKRGQAQYHDFEYLAVRATAWLKRNPQGVSPHPFARVTLHDRFKEVDLL